MKAWIINHLLLRNPLIRSRYQTMRSQRASRFQSLLYLLWLFILYAFSPSFRANVPRLSARASESSLSYRKSPEEFVKTLMDYDVISFDVFDTLLFRPFSDPTDLFYLIGEALSYPNFRAVRIEIERKLRQKQRQTGKSGEITLEEIWQALEKETGIPKEEGFATEWRLEQRCCFANPYMRSVVDLLGAKGKILAAVSDMYLSTKQIQSLLNQCGYCGFSIFLVSGEEKTSKADGGLYRSLQRHAPLGSRIVHIGDNPFSDGKQAKKAGICSLLYPNVQKRGNRYRSFDLSPVIGSVYRGISNAHLHNGLNVYSPEYEYGFLYGGLFTVGYCRFIHDLAESRSFQKLLFLSRDGAVLLKAYRMMYPAEAKKTFYAYWSRQAACKITASLFKTEYFDRFLFHKADGAFSLRQILESMELDPLEQALCEKTGLNPEEKLTYKNMDTVKSYLQTHWEEVLSLYQPQIEAAKQYYSYLLGDCSRAGAVDIGWMGSGAVMLNAAVNRLWGLDCPITGILAGTLSAHSATPDATDPLFLSGQLISYLYSSWENRDLWKFHNPSKNHNLYWELLLGAPEGSLKGIDPDAQNGWRFRFRDPPSHPERRNEIHRGILDFVALFLEMESRSGYPLPISGRDAYAPMMAVCRSKNRRFQKRMEVLLDEAHIG